MRGMSKQSTTTSLATSNRSIFTIQRLKESITSTQVAFMLKDSSTLMLSTTTGVTPWSTTTSRQPSSLQLLLMFSAARLQSFVRNRSRAVQPVTSTAMMETHRVLSTTKQPATMSSSTTMRTGSVTHVTHQHKDMAIFGKTRLSPSQVLT